LTEYDLSSLTPVRFELKRKDKSVNLRLPEDLLAAVRSRAQKEGIPYQRFIRPLPAGESPLQRHCLLASVNPRTALPVRRSYQLACVTSG
jgi:CopG antitoxin of type II toxin-antitoxin system